MEEKPEIKEPEKKELSEFVQNNLLRTDIAEVLASRGEVEHPPGFHHIPEDIYYTPKSNEEKIESNYKIPK